MPVLAERREYTALEREAQLERFHELARYFRLAGCCEMCAHGFAIIQVSREWGEDATPTKCFKPESKCRDNANAARAAMPRRATERAA
jgi:hypothetical protein